MNHLSRIKFRSHFAPFILILSGFTLLVNIGFAASLSQNENPTRTLLESLQSNEFRIQHMAVLKLIEHPERYQNDPEISQIQDRLLLLLNQETRYLLNNEPSEARYDFMYNIIKSVTIYLKSDDKIIEPLIGTFDTGMSAKIIYTALAEFGDRSADALMKSYMEEKSPEQRRVKILRSFKKIAGQKNLSKDKSKELNELLCRVVKDKSPLIRIAAVNAMASTSNLEFIPLLETIAQKDSFSKKHDKLEGIHYPIRELAQKAISSIQEKRTKEKENLK